jgi:hypothetical protein
MTIDTTKLRALARAATPGPWTVGEDERECAATLRARPVRAGETDPCGPPIDVIIPFGRAYSDAAFIAAVHPQAVVELLDDNAQLREACTKWQDHFTETPGLAAANAEIVVLRSQLAAMTNARNVLAEIAEAATFIIDNHLCDRCRAAIANEHVETIDALRKAGA